MFYVHSDFWFALFRGRYKDSKCWAVSSIISRISRYTNFKLTCSIVFVDHIDVHIQQFSIYTKLSKTNAFEKQNRSTEGCSKLKRSVDMTSSGKNLKNQFFLLLHTACRLHNLYRFYHERKTHMWSVCNEMYHNVFRYEYLTFQTQIPLHKQYIFDINNIQSEYAFLFPFSIVQKVENKWFKSAKTSWNHKGWCNEPTKLQFQSILNTENFDALQTLRINRNRP